MPDFPFHDQECSDYCGAACLMMMMRSQGADLTGISQFQLMQAARDEDESGDFFCPPESIAAVAEAQLKSLKPSLTYMVVSDNPPSGEPAFTAETIPQVVESCITQHTAPVFLLAQGGVHWMLVYDKSGEGFNWRNPKSLGYPGSEEGVAEQHRTHTVSPCVLCGIGNLEEALFPAQLRNLLPVCENFPSYAGQRILVIPALIQTEDASLLISTPELPPSPETSEPAFPSMPDPNAASPEPLRVPPPPESIVRLPEDFLKSLTSRLPDYAELFRTHGGRLKDAKLGLGVKVEHLSGNPKLDYLLFPVFLDAAAPYFIIQLSADTHELLTMTGITAPKPGEEPWFYAPEGREELDAKLREKAGQLPGGWRSNRRLVWRYCLQSNTPMVPFHEVTRDDEIGYMDVFGKVHKKLEFPVPRRARPDTPQA
jgi:hypothetical protein